MDYHQNGRLVIHSREQLALGVIEQGLTLKQPAAGFHVSAKTAAKWVRRYRVLGRPVWATDRRVRVDVHAPHLLLS